MTGDGSLFPFEELPGGRQDVVVNGVSRAGGALGTFWRTDARLFNAAAEDASVTVSFHAAGDSNASPPTTTVNVPAGQVVEVVDALGTYLNLPVGSSGALRFQSETAVAVLCRTSNLDPTGARPGTFGAQQRAVPLLSYLMSGDAGAVVTGVKQNGSYRTNVGFAAGEAGADYTLTLLNAAGGALGTAPGKLGVFGWTQPNIANLFPGVSIPDDAQLRVKVAAGSLDVYDSSIDAGSGDPVITRIAPLPTPIPSSATIGSAGGSVRSDDGRLTLKVPAGALTVDTPLSVESEANGVPQGTGPGYALNFGDQDVAKPILLVLAYDATDTDGSAAGELGLAFESGGNWYVATGGSVDPVAHTLTVPFRSTSPAVSAPVAANSPPRIERRRTRTAPFNSLVLVPKMAAVLQGSRLGFRLSVKGMPSSVGAEAVARTLDSLSPPDYVVTKWMVNWIPGGSASFCGTISGDAVLGAATYLAPSCDSLANPVQVQVEVIGGSKSRRRLIWSPVRIVPRNWTIWLKNDVWAICNPQPFSFEYQSSVDATFHLDESLQVVYEPGSAKVKSGRVEPKNCAGSCTATMGPIDPLRISSVTGSWDVARDRLQLKIDGLTMGLLSFTYPCTPILNNPGGPGLPTSYPVKRIGDSFSYSYEELSGAQGSWFEAKALVKAVRVPCK